MKYLHLPPFLVAHGDRVIVACDVAAHQIHGARAVILVCKDLAHQTNLFRIPVQPALHHTVLWKFQLVYRNETLRRPVLLTHRHEPVAFERSNEVLALARDVLEVLLRGEPAVHQHKPELQGVLNARPDHLAHHLVFRLLAVALDLSGHQVAVLIRLGHQLERHRYRAPLAVVQRIEQVDALDRSTFAVVIMPAHQITLVGPGFLLDRVVEDQHPFGVFNPSDRGLDLAPQVLGRVVALGQKPRNAVMTHLPIKHRRQARRSHCAERAQQIIRVQLQIHFLHGQRLAKTGCGCVRSVRNFSRRTSTTSLHHVSTDSGVRRQLIWQHGRFAFVGQLVRLKMGCY